MTRQPTFRPLVQTTNHQERVYFNFSISEEARKQHIADGMESEEVVIGIPSMGVPGATESAFYGTREGSGGKTFGLQVPVIYGNRPVYVTLAHVESEDFMVGIGVTRADALVGRRVAARVTDGRVVGLSPYL